MMSFLLINEIPFQGMLTRLDAAGGWKLTIKGIDREITQIAGVDAERVSEIFLYLAQRG